MVGDFYTGLCRGCRWRGASFGSVVLLADAFAQDDGRQEVERAMREQKCGQRIQEVERTGGVEIRYAGGSDHR